MTGALAALFALALAAHPAPALAQVSYAGSSTIGEHIIPEAAKVFTAKTGIRFGAVEIQGSGKGLENGEELRARVKVGARVVTLQQGLAERVRALEDALARVKRLQGPLPICAWCKKVRNDQNYWQQVEGYVAEHSEARFSHSICPECKEKYVTPEIRRRQEGAP